MSDFLFCISSKKTELIVTEIAFFKLKEHIRILSIVQIKI